MTTRQRGIGPVPENLGNTELEHFLTQIRRLLVDVQSGRVASLLGGGGSSGGGGGGTTVIIDGGSSDPTPDYTPPPTVSGGSVSAGLTFVFIETDAPTFTQGHGYNRTIVYGATYDGSGPEPTFGNAVIVHEFVGQVGSFSSEPSTKWHLWLRWRSNDGILSTAPAGGTNGFECETGEDVELLLEALSQAIGLSELQTALSTEIGLISAGSGVAGSVNARVLTEKTERQAGDAASAASISQVSARLNVGGDTYTSIVQAQTTATAAVGTANTAASQVTTVQSRINRVVNYKIESKGTSSAVGNSGFYSETGTQLYAAASTYRVVVLNGSTSAVVSSTAYNVAASTANATAMASALNGLAADVVVVVLTSGNPAANKTAGGLPAALLRCGASQLILDRIRTGGAYILVGIPGMGEGNGIEKYAGDTDNANNAWVEYSLQTLNGRPVALGGNPIATSVQQEITTRAAIDGHISSLYAVRVQATQGGSTVMGGFGIMGTSSGTAGPTIDFGVLANKFYIGAPVGSTGVSDIQPFVVNTTVTTINGVSVPVGVFMDAAYIRNGDITSAKIGNAQITDAKIVSLSVDKLLAGSLSVGQYIQSSNYNPGVTGFKINHDGSAYFNTVAVRGEINGGAYTGAVWPPSGTGFHLGPYGLLLGNLNTGGAVEITSAGTFFFGNSILGNSLTFDGTNLALNGQLINTSNIVPNAVTESAADASIGLATTILTTDLTKETIKNEIVALTSTGANVTVSGSITAYLSLGNSAVSNARLRYRLWMDTTIIDEVDIGYPAMTNYFNVRDVEACVPVIARVEPAAGLHRYYVQVFAAWFNSSGTSVTAGASSELTINGNLVVQENKA